MGNRLQNCLRDIKKRNPYTQSYEEFPTLHSIQDIVIKEAKRYNVLCAGRRLGKSTLAAFLLLYHYRNAPRLYVAPTFDDLTPVWDETLKYIPGNAIANKANRTIYIPDTDIRIDFKSAEKPDRMRGRKYALAIIDEGGVVTKLKELIEQVIKPTLIDYEGSLWVIGTPKGQNYFADIYASTEYKQWNFSSYSNPYIPHSELDALKETLPERVYRQEILAEFISDGQLFSNVLEVATGKPKEYVDGHTYAMGIDIAFQHDYTAIVVIDVTDKEVVQCYKGQWELQVLGDMLVTLNKRYNPEIMRIDATGMGVPVMQYLTPLNLPLKPVTLTKEIKEHLINNLIVFLEQKKITLLNNKDMIQELSVFEEKNGKYSAPAGYNDDIVIALALGVWALRE